MPHWLLQK